MTNQFEAGGNLRELAHALADSGRCEDVLDIEMELLASGHSPAEARRATADDAIRASLNERCMVALRQRA